MKFFSTRFNFKAIGKSMVVPGVGAALVITLSTMNGCSQSDRSTESRDEVIAQNAAEAEAADEKMTAPKAEEKTAAKTPEKTEKAKEKKTAKAETHKADAHAEAKTAAAHEARKPASAGGVFVVQVGAFKVKENAEKLQEKLNAAGYHVEMQTVDHSRNGTLHLVRFQAVTNRAEAETMIEDLHAKHDLQAQIVTVSSATATH